MIQMRRILKVSSGLGRLLTFFEVTFAFEWWGEAFGMGMLELYYF
jgi:hypothetical protein